MWKSSSRRWSGNVFSYKIGSSTTTIGYFIIHSLAWFLSTFVTVIYSKNYLNLTSDPHTLTLTFLASTAFLKLIITCLSSSSSCSNGLFDLINLFNNINYWYLGIFNIGAILLTNIALANYSLFLIYTLKVNMNLYSPNFIDKMLK